MTFVGDAVEDGWHAAALCRDGRVLEVGWSVSRASFYAALFGGDGVMEPGCFVGEGFAELSSVGELVAAVRNFPLVVELDGGAVLSSELERFSL